MVEKANPIVYDESIRKALNDPGPPMMDVLQGKVDLPPHPSEGAGSDYETWLSCPDCGATPEYEARYCYGVVYECPDCGRRVDIEV